MSDEQTLAGLIADRKGTRSYDRLSRDCGGVPTSKRLHQLATVTPKNFPDPDTIRGLAAGLGVTVTDIVMASARSLGLSVYTGNDPSALSIGGAGELPDSAKETLTTVAREFIKLTSQQTVDGDEDAQDAESRTEEDSPELGGAGGGSRKSGAPMKPKKFREASKAAGIRASNVQRGALTAPDQGSRPDLDENYVPGPDILVQSDYELARREGETAERRRRRIEGEPWDQADPDGPEAGA
ncbi:hypothetical protein R1X32_42585 [Rhodococcus opacus]|uniref:hypothetical protein n=1 Tax=Rhodococcus opacus TaxID=37919 RepID=UPI0034D1A978